MSLRYDSAPTSGCLIQGEILADVWEHRSLLPPTELQERDALPYEAVYHDAVVVLNPWCDLYYDFEARQDAASEGNADSDVPNDKEVPYVFLCDAFEEKKIRARGVNRAVWRGIEKNQDPRYHFLPSAPVGAEETRTLPGLCLDFKKSFAIPTDRMYEGLGVGVSRVAVIPRVFREHLMVRYGYFMARVSLP